MSVLHLQYLHADGERDVFHLKGVRRYQLGRGSACEVRILDMKMSRQHCALEERKGRWYLIDHGSTNGVSVDGVKIQGVLQLEGGELIHAGSSELNVLAISDHLDLAPEALMELGGPAPQQDPLPPVTEEVPVASNDNPWEGEPQRAPMVDTDALRGPKSSASASQAGQDPDTEAVAKPHLQPVRTPVPEPVAALPHQDGDALEPSINPGIAAAIAPRSSEASGPSLTPSQTAAPETAIDVAKPKVAVDTAATPKRSPSSAADGMMVVTLLDQRIGPIPRDLARELKKKQIMGTLTEAELSQYPRA